MGRFHGGGDAALERAIAEWVAEHDGLVQTFVSPGAK